MSRNKEASPWRGRTTGTGAGDWLRGLAVMVLIALVGCGSAFLLPNTAASADALPVVISRVMTSNPSACYSLRGKYYDWLELQNISDDPVDLAGWKLTDKGDLRGAFTFGDITLPPGGTLMVYCHEAPEGFDGPEVFCGFKLSANGETLLLADATQHVSSLEVPPIGKRDVYQRDPKTGRYIALSFIEALGMDTEYTSTLTPPYNPNGVTINEVMPVNRSTLTDEDGDYSDWIELYNGAAEAVSLQGCSLSDDDANRRKWIFPDVTLKPGQYLIVFCSGKDRTRPDRPLHTNFRLSRRGEAIRLYNPAADAISYVRYESAMKDVSFSRLPDGTMTARLDPSPGYPNNEQGAREATAAMLNNSLGLYINEIYTAGSGADWAELYNSTNSAIELAGMGFSDNPSKPRKWQFPAGATIPAGGYVVIRLDGKPDAAAAEAATAEIKVPAPEGSEEKHRIVTPDYTADIGLSEGEKVCLTSPEGAVIDRVKLYDQVAGISYGRVEGQSSYRYFTQPTPGQPNAAESYGKVAKPIGFSTPPGIVRDASIQLRMSTTPGVPIYYTTDGSAPSAKSKRYDGAISLDSNTCIRAVALGDDVAPSEPVVASFIFGQHSLRLVSVIGDASKLNRGALRNGKKGSKAGTPVIAEIYEKDGTRLIAQECSFNMVGHHSRTHIAQKSFKLTARRANGDTRFRAKLFTHRDYEEVKAVVLRASGQDAMQSHMRDSVLTTLAADTSVMYQETEPCVVYVNGIYWGEYNLREHVDQHSIAQFEGWENPDDVVISEGSEKRTDYHKLLSWVSSHDLSSDANVETLRSMMDIENYLDYVILEMYTCNQDLNNVRRYCNPREDPRWKWVLFDLDLSYQLDRNNVKDWLGAKVGSITSQDGSPFRYLMRNDTLRDYFLTRFGQLLATTLSAENVAGKFQARHDLLAEEMVQTCKRWKWKYSTWENWVQRSIRYAQNRPKQLIGFLKETFRLSDAQAQGYFGDALAQIGADN